ncbi:MAG: alpha/beta hydrolase [Pseudomonadota bacterium]
MSDRKNAHTKIKRRRAVRFSTALLVLAVLSACGNGIDRDPPVGRTVFSFEDTSRPSYTGSDLRPLVTTVWYPARSGTAETAWRIGIFLPGHGAVDAPMADSAERLPLIVLSHGTGGAAAQLSWLAEELVQEGYLVAAVNHHGNTAAEPNYHPQGFALWWERATDVSVVIDRLLASSKFADRIDTDRIGVAGFSLGGFTALLTAGARVDRNQWRAFCEATPDDVSCRLPPEAGFSPDTMVTTLTSDPWAVASLKRAGDSYRDDRIKAAFLIAPVLNAALTQESLQSIVVPVALTVGDGDQQAVANDNAVPMLRAIPESTLTLLPQVSHYTFLSRCSLKGRVFVRALCAERGDVSRVDTHRRVAADAVAFFDQAL